ncbi:hypothetical protein F0562_034624 [Nyssa sinensis]|uniref:Uncharacterized protein n=1 Tax=Nyssa sinensis TaxID=561372 RepID=A0A5J5AAF4_9ASTE|nr:hypothetical protein F0562_034624 [Nyssa sinensis]
MKHANLWRTFTTIQATFLTKLSRDGAQSTQLILVYFTSDSSNPFNSLQSIWVSAKTLPFHRFDPKHIQGTG